MTTPPNSAAPHSPANAFRVSGAILGILVFLAGIALVGYVFATARVLFDAPPPTIPAPPAGTGATTATGAGAAAGSATSSAAIVIGQALTQFLQRLLVLLLMCVAGSVIASRGIALFFHAISAATPPAPGGRGGRGAASPAPTTQTTP